MGDESKRYSDREVSAIIQGALDLGRKDGGGLLLSEIEEIARETGIPVEHVRLALERVREGRDRTFLGGLLGSPTSLERVDLVPRSLSQAQLESLNKSLPMLTDSPEPSLVAEGSLSWRRGLLRSFLDGFPLSLSISQAEGGTRIAATARLGPVALALFAAAGGLGALAGIKVALLGLFVAGIGTLSLPASLAALALGGFVGLGGFWLLARRLYRRFVQRSRERLGASLARIKAAIQGLKE